MVEKNFKLKASDLNTIKTRLNAELALRGGQGSVYGYKDDKAFATVGKLTLVPQWETTMGVDINLDVLPKIASNEKYTLANEYNALENSLNIWEKRINPTETGVPATTHSTSCNTSCTGLCYTACFSGCTGACTKSCSTSCGVNCTGGSKNADGS